MCHDQARCENQHGDLGVHVTDARPVADLGQHQTHQAGPRARLGTGEIDLSLLSCVWHIE